MDLRGNDLGKDILVGESDNESVLGGTVLVLVLGDELVSLTVVSLSLSSSSELDLVPLKVSLVLHYFNECLRDRKISLGRIENKGYVRYVAKVYERRQAKDYKMLT